MFTAGQFFLNSFSFFVGMALDYLPKSILLSATAMVEITGLMLLAISDTTGETDRNYFYVAYSLLAIGGSATMLSSFPASFLLKTYQAGLLAMISCLFDCSSIIFSIGKALQDKLGWSRRDMLVLYTAWGFAVYIPLIMCWIVLERKNWQQVLEAEDEAEEERLFQQRLDDGNDDKSLPEEPNADPRFLAHVKRIQKMDIFGQLRTRDFAFTMFFVATHMLQCNYYVMTVDAYLLSLGDTDSKYATIFSWALPCGIFFVPCIERTVTYLGIVNTLHTTNIFALVFGMGLFVPALPFQVGNFFIFTCFRAYLYATINTLIATTFGVATMGRIIGVVFSTAAVVGLVQYPMAVVSEVTFDGDYMPINFVLLVVATLPAILTVCYGGVITSSEGSAENDDIAADASQVQAWKKARMSPALLLASPGREIIHSLRRARRKQDDADLA
jgi:MFS family permease